MGRWKDSVDDELDVRLLMREALAVGEDIIFISPSQEASAVVRVEHRRTSVGPQLQALAGQASWAVDAGLSTAQFGTVWRDPGRWTFTDCRLVNLVWALAQAGSGPVSVGLARARQPSEATAG